MTETLVQPATDSKSKAQTIGSFGEGRYSPLMSETYKDAQVVFRLSEQAADKLARQVGSDFGAAMRNVQVTASIKRGASKDGKITLSEAAKQKGVTETHALTAMAALDFANKAGKAGFIRGSTKWEVNEVLKEYFATLE